MSEKPLASKRIQAIREAAREAMTRRGPRDVDPIWLEHALKYYGYATVPREASEGEIGAGAHVLSGAIGARCCHVTGGYGPTAGREEARDGCDCRDLVIEIRAAMIAKAEEE